jgi:sugar/nucleoside kinase (ribokinase family)
MSTGIVAHARSDSKTGERLPSLISSSARLVHVGNVLVDIVLHVPRLPLLGGDVLATASQIQSGAAFNVLVAAARQGLNCAYGGAHGCGVFGDIVRADLRCAYIDVLLPVKPDIDTGFTIVMVDESGERTFATSVGAESQITNDELMALRVQSGDIVCLSGYGLLPAPRGQLVMAWLDGLPPDVRVVFDPQPVVAQIDQTLVDRILARCDWLSCNAAEAAALTGASESTIACERLLASVRGGVVVRIGAGGCLLAERNATIERIPAFNVEAVDTNGAGDTHLGVFLAGLCDGLDPRSAARRGNAAAALSIMRRGPATAPTREELDAFLAEHGL